MNVRLAVIAVLLAIASGPALSQQPIVSLPTTSSVSRPLIELATLPAATQPVRPPIALPVREEDRKFVAETLRKAATQPASTQPAVDALVARGESMSAALKDALPTADEAGKKTLNAALAELDWGQDVPKLIFDWAREKNKDFPLNGEVGLNPVPLSSTETVTLFPKHRFYLVAYPSFPVAMMPPAPLASRNIFIVSKDSKLIQVAQPKDLETFLKAALPPVKTADDALTAAGAWLLVAKELASDGMFQFAPNQIVATKKDGGGLEVTGKALAAQGGGNAGGITAVLTFDADGKLKDVQQTVNLRPGMRPICQATKLLDADPIVRKMARQDLLIMGSSAWQYLALQHAKANPALRKAIEDLWQDILAREEEGRRLDAEQRR